MNMEEMSDDELERKRRGRRSAQEKTDGRSIAQQTRGGQCPMYEFRQSVNSFSAAQHHKQHHMKDAHSHEARATRFVGKQRPEQVVGAVRGGEQALWRCKFCAMGIMGRGEEFTQWQQRLAR